MTTLAEMTWQGHRGARATSDHFLHLVDGGTGKSLCGYQPTQLIPIERAGLGSSRLCPTCRDKAWL